MTHQDEHKTSGNASKDKTRWRDSGLATNGTYGRVKKRKRKRAIVGWVQLGLFDKL